jgi:hypothetical protein
MCTQEERKKQHNVDLNKLYILQSIIRIMMSRGMRGKGMRRARGRRGMHIGFSLESQKRPLGRPRCGMKGNIKMDLRLDEMVWAGLIWLRIKTSGGLL